MSCLTAPVVPGAGLRRWRPSFHTLAVSWNCITLRPCCEMIGSPACSPHCGKYETVKMTFPHDSGTGLIGTFYSYQVRQTQMSASLSMRKKKGFWNNQQKANRNIYNISCFLSISQIKILPLLVYSAALPRNDTGSIPKEENKRHASQI